MNWKMKKTSKIGKNSVKKSRQLLVTKAKQQMQNGRSKHSDRARSILLIL